jgi:hypothetical protein
LPYDGAKEMLLVDEVDDREYLTGLFETIYAEFSLPKPNKKIVKFQSVGQMAQFTYTTTHQMDS